MKKFGLVLAALGAVIIALPSMASAQAVVIKRGGGYHGHHHGYSARAQVHRDRGYHRGHRGQGNKVVIIKKRHRY
jgi:hypothetical protein